MARMTHAERGRAIGMLHAGASYRQVKLLLSNGTGSGNHFELIFFFYFDLLISIHLQVARALNRHHSSIQALKQKFDATGSVADRPGMPKRRVTTQRQDRYIVVSHLRDRFRPASVTSRQIQGHNGRNITPQTVRNRLRDAGIRCRRPLKGVLLTAQHRAARLAWARRHLRFTRADWANVLFVDETRISLQFADGRVRVYRRRGERYSANCVVQTNQFRGGSIMIFAGVSMHTKTPAIVVRGNLTARRYIQDIVQPVLVPHLAANRGMQLLQDNATCHVARQTMNVLRANNIRVIQFPAKSPDLNIIEHVWDLFKRRIRSLPQPPNLQALERDAIQVWQNLQQNDFQRFIMSMRSRCRAVIAARGGHTRY